MNKPLNRSSILFRRTALSRRLKTQAGVTLVEVLVSVMLMSFALLGMAAMQAQSLSQQVSATSRANISALLADVTDHLRANLSQAPGYNPVGTPVFAVATTWSAQTATPAVPSTDCNAVASCSAADRATFDLTNWRRKVRAELPQGSVQIAGGTQGGVNITLMWADKDFREGETLRQSPTCTSTMTAGAAQTCCPSAASAPAGVRCHNTTILP